MKGQGTTVDSVVYVKDQLGHHSIRVAVAVHGHLVPGANKAAVGWLDRTAILPVDWRDCLGDWCDQAWPPRDQAPSENASGATDCSVTPRQELVELRGLEPLTPRLPALCSPN